MMHRPLIYLPDVTELHILPCSEVVVNLPTVVYLDVPQISLPCFAVNAIKHILECIPFVKIKAIYVMMSVSFIIHINSVANCIDKRCFLVKGFNVGSMNVVDSDLCY